MRALGYFLFAILAIALFSLATAGASFTSCGEISSSGSHTVDNDVTSDGNCFNITASNVDLDCQGNTIMYNNESGTATVAGFNVSSVENITLRNCIVDKPTQASGTAYGYYSEFVNDTTFDNVTFYNERASIFYGGYFYNSTNVSFLNSSILGVRLFNNLFYGLYFLSTSNVDVIDSVILSNTSLGGYGIFNNNLGSNNYTIMNSDIQMLSFSSTTYGLIFGNGFGHSGYVIKNNIIRARGANAVGGLVIPDTTDVVIDNNSISALSTIGGVFYPALNVRTTDNLTISNNILTMISASNPVALQIGPSARANLTNNILNSSKHWVLSSSNLTSNFTNTTFMTDRGSVNLPGHFNFSSLVNAESRFFNQTDLNITQNRAFLNSSALPFLNLSGQVSLNGITLSNPYPYMDFDDDGVYEQCFAICSIVSFVNNVFTFNVAHFTSYRAQENPAPGGPVDNSGGGGGPGYDERFTSTSGIYEAQFGDKPVIEEIVEEVVEEETVEKEILEEKEEIEQREDNKVEEKIEDEKVDLEQKIEERNTRIQNLIVIIIVLLVLIILFVLWKRKKNDEEEK